MAKFSNEQSFAWLERNHESIGRFLKRVKETSISPLVKQITIGKDLWGRPDLVDFVQKCLSLFPVNALKRNHCKQIDFLDTLWFSSASTAAEPIVTSDIKQAETKFSLPCGHSSFLNYNHDKTNVYEMKIELFKFPDYVSELVVWSYLAYVVIHEFAHTLQMPAFYWRSYAEDFLQTDGVEPTYTLLIGGEKVDPRKFQETFIKEAIAFPPITTYSAVYKDVINNPIRTFEYMADYIATYIMGFAMNPTLSMIPVNGFDDRPELYKMIKSFIESEAVIVCA